LGNEPEVWLRGPISGVPAALQPAAHALLQTAEDIAAATAGLSDEELWATPGGAASIGFHLVHLRGATDRLCTIARGEALGDAPRAFAAAEAAPPSPRPDRDALVAAAVAMLNDAIDQLRKTDPVTLGDPRSKGRTTVGGLLFHAAEHSQRHAGQIVTTAKVVRSGQGISA
jgi:hypothetical protein